MVWCGVGGGSVLQSYGVLSVLHTIVAIGKSWLYLSAQTLQGRTKGEAGGRGKNYGQYLLTLNLLLILHQ